MADKIKHYSYDNLVQTFKLMLQTIQEYESGADIGFIDGLDSMYIGSEMSNFWYMEGLKSIVYTDDCDLEYDDNFHTIYYDDDTDDFGYDEDEKTIYFRGYDVTGEIRKLSDIIDFDTGNTYQVYDTEAHEDIAVLTEDTNNKFESIETEINNVKTAIPTKTSELENDSDYATTAQIEAATKESVVEVTLSADAWSSDYPYTQTVSVEGVTADSLFYVGILYPEDCDRDTQEDINESAGYLFAIDSGDGEVTFKATELPTADIPLGLRGVF